MQINIDVLGKLIPNILTVVTQLCATAVLFLLMRKLAWKPVHNILLARSEFEQKQLDDAQRMKQDTQRLADQAKADSAKAALQARDYIEQGRSEGQKIKDQLVAEGKTQAQLALDKARQDIDVQKQQMQAAMYDDIVEVAMEASAKVLSDSTSAAGAPGQKKAVEKFVKEVMDK